MPLFGGAGRQRGHGLGNIFGRSLRNVLVPIATRAINSGIDVAGDMARGKTFGEYSSTDNVGSRCRTIQHENLTRTFEVQAYVS